MNTPQQTKQALLSARSDLRSHLRIELATAGKWTPLALTMSQEINRYTGALARFGVA